MDTIYRGCVIPADLHYHLEYDVWARFGRDDEVTLGMTDMAQTASGKLMHISFKRPGKTVRSGGSAATIESAKWVGPFRMPFDAEILANNRLAFDADVLAANRDPYGEGWLVRVRPLEAQLAQESLHSGAEAIALLKQQIDTNEIRCFRCVDEAVPGGNDDN